MALYLKTWIIDLYRSEIDSLNQKAFDIIYSNLEEASAITKKAVVLAAEKNYTPGIAWGLLNSGLIDMECGDLEESLEKLHQAKKKFIQDKTEHNGYGAVLNSLGLVCIRLGNMNQAFMHLQESLRFCEIHSLKSLEYTAVNYIGILQFKSSRYNQALRFFQKSFKLRTDEKTTNVLNNIGCTYRAMGQNDNALDYLNRALEQSKIEGKSDAVISILEEIGLTHGQMEDYEQGIKFLNSALDICVGTNRRHRPGLYINLGEQYLKLEDLSSAEEVLHKAERLITDSNQIDHRELYILLSGLEESKGNKDLALALYKKYQQSCESLKSGDLEEGLWLLETEQIRKMNTQVDAISKMGQELTAFLDRQEILTTLSRSLFRLFSIDACVIAEIPKGNNHLQIQLYTSADKMRIIELQEVSPPREFVSWVIANSSGLILNDIKKDVGNYIFSYDENILSHTFSSVLSFPFKTAYARGAIGIYSFQKNKFNEEDWGFMEMLCSFAAIALNNAFQTELIRSKNNELTMLNRFDALTGIFNRKHILSVMEKNLKQCSRLSSYIHVMLLDADHFKKINDTWGHDLGDQSLRLIASAISENLQRSTDSYGRYGGEEFLFSLQGLTVDEALSQAERIREYIESSSIEHKGESIKLTVSIGVCSTIPGSADCRGLNDLIKAADKCMYQSKTEGRNLVRSVIL